MERETWVLVTVAGGAGTLLRYLLGGTIASAIGGTFPWETFVINALGCLAIGVIAGVIDKGTLMSIPVRTALMVGFIGGFTTFSTFALDAFRLSGAGQWASAVAYMLLSNGVGYAAVCVGYRAALRA